MGFEPATACLQNRCSTIELRRRTDAAPAKLELGNNLHIHSGCPSSLSERDRPLPLRELACAKRNCKPAKDGGSPGTRTPNQLIKSQLLYH